MTDTLVPAPTEQQRRMHRFFSAVCNPSDWKAPIDANVPDADVAETSAAITFMTATEATVTSNGDGTSRVQSIGYRRGPAGDH